MTTIGPFLADYPSAIVFPCEETNCYNPAGHGDVPNQPRAFILHTPEEPADGYPGTPHWFATYHANQRQRGSTIYFVAYTGDVYQCLPESWGAIANGFNPGDPQRLAYPLWAGPFSLNWQTLNVEIEGYASNIEDTLTIGGPQWNALVALVRDRCQHYGIPIDREHIMGHYQLSVDRTDPGAGFPWDAFLTAVQGGRMYSDKEIDDKVGAVLAATIKVQQQVEALQTGVDFLIKVVNDLAPRVKVLEDK